MCINGQIFILKLQNVIVDLLNKIMSVWSVKISICSFSSASSFLFSQWPSIYKHQELFCECHVLKCINNFNTKRFIYFFDICFLVQYNYNNIHGCVQMNELCVFELEFKIRILVWSMLIQCVILIGSIFDT